MNYILAEISRIFYFYNNFFSKNFNLWRPFLMITLYHQTILNSRSLIQLSETLLVKLTETHTYKFDLSVFFFNEMTSHEFYQFFHNCYCYKSLCYGGFS